MGILLENLFGVSLDSKKMDFPYIVLIINLVILVFIFVLFTVLVVGDGYYVPRARLFAAKCFPFLL